MTVHSHNAASRDIGRRNREEQLMSTLTIDSSSSKSSVVRRDRQDTSATAQRLRLNFYYLNLMRRFFGVLPSADCRRHIRNGVGTAVSHHIIRRFRRRFLAAITVLLATITVYAAIPASNNSSSSAIL